MKAWLGIDPGQSGAIALLTESGGALVEDFPGDQAVAADILREWSTCYQIQPVALERVSAMPNKGWRQPSNLGQTTAVGRGLFQLWRCLFICLLRNIGKRKWVSFPPMDRIQKREAWQLPGGYFQH